LIKSREWVTGHLYELYGEQIRAAPAFEGFGIVGWVLPGVLITVVAVVIVVRLRRLPNSAPHPVALHRRPWTMLMRKRSVANSRH